MMHLAGYFAIAVPIVAGLIGGIVKLWEKWNR